VTEISLQQLSSWTQIDACAQSCALSASSVFSRLFSCSSSDPASCICNAAPAVSAVAGSGHQCAVTSCTAFASYSDDPERARMVLSSYCWANGISNAPASATASTSASTSTTRES
jgi:hypothetical protein